MSHDAIFHGMKSGVAPLRPMWSFNILNSARTARDATPAKFEDLLDGMDTFVFQRLFGLLFYMVFVAFHVSL